MIGSHVTGTSGTSTHSRINGSQVSPSCDLGTHGLGLGSPGTGSHTTGTSLGRHSSNEDVEEGLPQYVTSKEINPSWLKDLVNEAEQSVGPPKREIRESRAPERFCSYMAMLTTTIDSEPSTFEEANSH